MSIKISLLTTSIVAMFSVLILVGMPGAHAGGDPDSLCIVTPQTHEVTLFPGQSIDVTTDIECSSFAETFTDITPDLTNCGAIVSNEFGARFFVTSPGFIKTTYNDSHTITYNGDGTPESVTCNIIWTTQGDIAISATQTIVVTVEDAPSNPSVQIIKTGSAKIKLGDAAEFAIKVQNTGDVDLVGCILTDSLAGFISDIGIIESGQVFSFVYFITLIEDAENIAVIECLAPDGTSVVAADAWFTVVFSPDVSIQKNVNSPVLVGESPQYQIIVQNTSPDGTTVLTNCEIVDDGAVPPLNASVATLAPGEQLIYNVVGPVLTTTEPFTNDASVSCDAQDGSTISDSDSVTVTPVEPFNPSVDIIKIGDVKITSGSEAHFMIEVINDGDEVLTNCLITDDEAGVTFVPLNLSVGESVEFNYSMELFIPGTFVNTAEIRCEDHLGILITNQDSSEVLVIDPDITITKTCDATGPTEPGTINWNIQVVNTGDTVLEAIIEDDQCGFSTVPNVFAPGSELNLECVNSELLAGTYVNSAIVTAVDQLDNSYVEEATAECTIGFSAPFRVELFATEIQQLSLPRGIENSLISLLEHLQVVLNGGAINGNSITLDSSTIDNSDDDDPCDMIQAMINKIEAQSGKKIDEADAADLIEKAEFIQELLECDTSTED